MKEALQTFFERTAHSRDANGFLDQYHRVEVDRFLLLIPKLSSLEQVESFISEVEYLIQLELYPCLMFCDEFLERRFKISIEKSLCQGDQGLVYLETNFNDLNKHLKNVGKSCPFFKYMLVDQPMQNSDGEVINLLHLNMTMPDLNLHSREALEWLKPFLEHIGPAFAMQMVESGKILEELFTKRGAGTLISLGYEFKLCRLEAVDQAKLCELLENGFMRKLKSNYIKKLKSNGASVLLERNYRGAIVIQPFEELHFLDKVVVAPEFFGRGMGSLLLDELTERLEQYSLEHPKLIWRARSENPFLPRYASLVYDFAKKYPGRCGTIADADYVYHFIGLRLNERERAYELMKSYPSSFRTSK